MTTEPLSEQIERLARQLPCAAELRDNWHPNTARLIELLPAIIEALRAKEGE